MNYINHYINQIICGDALEVLKEIPDESVNCCVCSPPYWGLRDYGIEPVIWDGVGGGCEHEWGKGKIKQLQSARDCSGGFSGKDLGTRGNQGSANAVGGELSQGNFCLKCNAWRGSLGLEPTFKLYVKHLCDIFDEVKRVLRKDGTCFINIGDSYGGSGNASGHTKDTKNLGYKTLEMGATQGNQKTTRQYAKCLLGIPERFKIEMIDNRGWIHRNTIIWWKPNCMPSSAPDRFTVDFEYLYFFTKSNKTLFWTNEKTLECVSKKPSGTKGIEGKDWDWKKIGENYENYNTKISREDAEKYNSLKARKYRKKEWKKVSLWKGHDYWFEQQFEELNYDSFRETKRGKDQPKAKIGDLMSASVNARESLDKWKINLNGRNRRCVWKISLKGFPEAHFAVYPEGLVEIPIKAGCPEFVCKKCGKARVKICENDHYPTRPYRKSKYKDSNESQEKQTGLRERWETIRKETGYTDCGCKNPEYGGGMVLDPFMGAGTTALVALKQRKRFIGIEIKQDYIDMAYKRIAKVQQEIF